MHKIPLINLKNKTLVDLCRQEKELGIALLNATKNSYGIASRLASFIAFPLGDRLSRRLLKKTHNPYTAEIDEMAAVLGAAGVHALNLSYEWGCTSGVFKTDTGPQLVRVLDWPFPGLGESTVIAQQDSPAGEYYNITWPGIAGIFQASAPGRFAAAINQAPLRRTGAGVVIDWVSARFLMYKQASLPPAHLLRHVFETAPNYETAKKLLTETPVSIPVIYILSGANEKEGCIIERTENKAFINELGSNDNVTTANHFSPNLNTEAKGWRSRGIDSAGRQAQLCSLNNQQLADNFDWFEYPVANHLTRLVVVADAASNKLRVMGTNADRPVTQVFKL